MLHVARLVALSSVCCSLAFAQNFVGSGLTRLTAPNDGSVTALTASGQMLGTYPTETGSPGFVYDGATFQTIGHFGSGSSSPVAMNASGVVIGASSDTSFNTTAFVWAGNTLTNLGTLGGSLSWAYAVNDAGTVVGAAENASGHLRAYSYSGGALLDLGTLGGDTSSAYSINQSGAIVGSAQNGGGDIRPFLYTGGTMQDLGSFGGTFGVAYSINDAGQIAGTSHDAAGKNRAFLYQNGSMQDLGAPAGSLSVAISINSSGDVVGWFGDNESAAAFYYADGNLVNLNTLFASSLSDGSTSSGFVSLTSADQIFDDGRVFGKGRYFDLALGTTTDAAFLLTVTAIPEPSTYAALVGLGALGLALYRRRSAVR